MRGFSLSATRRGLRYHVRDILRFSSFGPSAGTGSRSRPDFDRLLTSAIQASAYSALRPNEGAADRGIERGVLRFVQHARKTAQDHFDPTDMINTAARAVHVLHTDADPLDRACKLSELHAQFLPDGRSLLLAEIGSQHTDMRWNQRYIRTAGLPLERFGNPAWKGRTCRVAALPHEGTFHGTYARTSCAFHIHIPYLYPLLTAGLSL